MLPTPVAQVLRGGTPVETTFTSVLWFGFKAPPSGALIYYTLDGTIPTKQTGFVNDGYGNFRIEETTIVKAIMFSMATSDTINLPSDMLTVFYIKKLLYPAFYTDTNSYHMTNDTIFSDSINLYMFASAGASIYYTLDGSMPDSNSTLYTGTFILRNTTTVKAIAMKPGIVTSDPRIKTYVKIPQTIISNDFQKVIRSDNKRQTFYSCDGRFIGNNNKLRAPKILFSEKLGISKFHMIH